MVKKLLQLKSMLERMNRRVPFSKFGANAAIPKLKNLSGVLKKSQGILKVWYSSDAEDCLLKLVVSSCGQFHCQITKLPS